MINCKARIIFDEKLLQISCQIKKLNVIEIIKTFHPTLFPYLSHHGNNFLIPTVAFFHIWTAKW